LSRNPYAAVIDADPWWKSHCEGCGEECRSRLCPECREEPWQPEPVEFVQSPPAPVVTLEEWQASKGYGPLAPAVA
jgi:hypothetical protein